MSLLERLKTLPVTSYQLHVAVADRGIALLFVDDGIGYQIKQLLCPVVAKVQDALPSDAVMDGKSHPDQRQIFFPGKGIPL